MQREAGLSEVEALESAPLVKRFPWLNPEACVGGTFCPTDGFLFPAVIYGDGARRVRELGGEIVQGAKVIGARHRDGRIDSLETARGSYSGDLFFDCTNAWTRRTSEILGAEVLPVDPLKRYLWFLSRAGSLSPESFAGMPLVVSPSGVYCRPENADTLLVGWAHETPPEPEFSYEDQDKVEAVFSHTGGLDAAPIRAWVALSESIPAIGEFAGITATTSGYYGSTPDHNPFFGFDRAVPNLIHLVGFSGHGAMFGPFTARVARELAEAGRDVDAIVLDGAVVSLNAFRIGRAFGAIEAMVI
jgi:glycine/D-amino acid oxidase-like deaminating enzyme